MDFDFKIVFKFKGNQSREFLKKVDLLQLELEKLSSETLLKGLPYIHAMRTFSKVVGNCFGNILVDSYIQDIQRFKDAYMALQISVTPKVFPLYPPPNDLINM